MASYNSCTFIGYLGKDPELQVTSEGTPVTRFSLAVSEKGKNGQESTTWLNIVCWRNLAEITEKYLHKGSQALVTGKLVIREFTDKQGVKRNAVDIVANDVRMLDRKPQDKSAEESPTSIGDPFLPEDVPF
jgi:single-strand DNA-binding protein